MVLCFAVYVSVHLKLSVFYVWLCVCMDVWKHEHVFMWSQVWLHFQTWSMCVCVLQYVHTHVCILYVCGCMLCCWDWHACILKMRLCLFLSTYISAYSEHCLSESEAVQTHFHPNVLPSCLSAEQWFSSSPIMARCKKSKKQPSGPGITMAGGGREEMALLLLLRP